MTLLVAVVGVIGTLLGTLLAPIVNEKLRFTSEESQQKRDLAQDRLFLTELIEMSLKDLAVHVKDNEKTIREFTNPAARATLLTKSTHDEFWRSIQTLLSTFPVPEIVEIPRTNYVALLVDFLISGTRAEIKKMNELAATVKSGSATDEQVAEFLSLVAFLSMQFVYDDLFRMISSEKQMRDQLLYGKSDEKENKKYTDTMLQTIRKVVDSHAVMKANLDAVKQDYLEKLRQGRKK